MVLIDLELLNFKGVRDLRLDFGGRDTAIIAANAKGKTTIMDSFIWLLTGRDHLGRTDYNIKTLEDGEAIPYLDHRVTATLEQDGERFTLSRNYKEVWQKKTGTNVQSFNGHKTEYAIDGVPKSEKEFSAFVERFAPMKLVLVLVVLGYFNEQLKAEDRRKMLLDMCGDVSEADLLALPQFAYLAPHITKLTSVADLKKAKVAQKSKINEGIKSIPTAINVHMQYLEVDSLDSKTEQAAIDGLQNQISALASERAGLSNGVADALLRKELAELEAERAEALAAARRAERSAVESIEKERDNRSDDRRATIDKIYCLKSELAKSKNELAMEEQHRAALLSQYHASEESTFDGGTNCPTCGQALPDNSVENAKAQFNENKAIQIEALLRDGNAAKARIAELKVSVSSYTAQIEGLEMALATLEKEISNLSQRIATSPAVTPDFDESRIESKKAEIADASIHTDGRDAEIASQIQSLQTTKSIHEQNLSRLKNAENARREIADLSAKEKELASAFEDCERLIALCDDFNNARVKMLDDTVSGAFRKARFKLTETLVNGGQKEICETLVDGVPYGAANNAAKVNINLDIVNSLSKHCGVVLPCFVDNAESVQRIEGADTQIIRLVVPTPFEDLPIEYQSYLIEQYGNEDMAKTEYESPFQALQIKAF